eukprot:CAMPEP_0181046558 /NCGR_PEP_ID=MMETSP1070-20121207/14413_1 /TAXON_ID=265543 /ORGANISM="Minutocellus polymorphus, Strain NH13" /LENGTH=676 /DNA_ID=CAMNT_0023125177 /DNA_START=240 /DNA_END=2270 /DNA_ORIENTATION=-
MPDDEKSALGSAGSPQQDGKESTSGDKDMSTSSQPQPNNEVPDSGQGSSSMVDMSTIDNEDDAEATDLNGTADNKSYPSPELGPAIPAQLAQPPDSPNLGANPDETDTLHSIMFNQDGGCLSVGTGRGFRVCNVWPFNETFRREFGANIQLGGGGGDDADGSGVGGDANDGGNDPDAANIGNDPADKGGGSGGGGGVGLCSMLYRTNLLALTSTTPPPINAHSRVTHSMHTAHHTAHNAATAGQLAQVTSPSFPPNKVLIYDDALSRPIGELSFRHRVLSVKLRRDRIVVILRDRIYVYRFSDLTLVDCVGTGRNEAGLCAISLEGATGTTGGGGMSAGSAGNDGDNAVMVLACPGVVTGQVRLELYGLRKTSLINAHESPLAALQVTNDGTMLVTASERGTVLRLFETGLVKRGHGVRGSRDATEDTTGKPIREFRRGVERATVTCLSFSLDNSWLGCGSDHGTVHVFRCWDNEGSDNANSGGSATAGSSSVSKKKKSKNPARLLSKVLPTTKKYFMSEEGSIAHVRGIPHPLACAFVPDRERTIAVAGTDELGNGCLLVAEFATKGSLDSEEMIRQQLLNGQSGTEVSKSGKVRRLGYHRFFRKTSIAHHIPSSQRRQQMRQNEQNGKHYDELRVGGAPSEGERNIDSVTRKLDDVVFSDEGGGDDGFDLVDVA